MKHPTPEEWMSFLYDELDTGERAALTDHLRGCADCAASVRDWQAARTQLHWPIRTRHAGVKAKHSPAFARTFLKWAAAVVVLAGLGFGAGRISSPQVDIGKLRAALAPEIQGKLEVARTEMREEFAQLLHRELDQSAATSSEQTREWLAACVETLETRRADENRNLYAALTRLQSQRDEDYLLLKQDVDIVALNADAGLRQLAGYTQPNSSRQP